MAPSSAALTRPLTGDGIFRILPTMLPSQTAFPLKGFVHPHTHWMVCLSIPSDNLLLLEGPEEEPSVYYVAWPYSILMQELRFDWKREFNCSKLEPPTLTPFSLVIRTGDL